VTLPHHRRTARPKGSATPPPRTRWRCAVCGALLASANAATAHIETHD